MSFSKVILSFCLIFTIFPHEGICEGQNKMQRHQNEFYHDLTNLIDKILVDGNISYHADLKNALLRSPLVFYETDMLLNNINEILPVIDLLQHLKLGDSKPQLMLSLRYVNSTNGHFLRTRVEDIYYNLQLNMSLNDRAKIVNHVSAISLDFRGARDGRDTFYQSNVYVRDILFPSYVKNFIKLHFGNEAISVGVIYRDKYDHIRRQIQAADFVIFCVEFNSYDNFPMFMESFNSTMRNTLSSNRQYLQYSQQPKHVTVLIKINDGRRHKTNALYPYSSSGDYWSTFNRVMSATAQYNATSQQFLSKAYNKSLRIIENVASKWANLEGYSIIISNPNYNFTSDTNTGTTDNERFPFVIPTTRTEEVNSDICTMMFNLSTWRNQYESVSMDEKTWRTVARYQQTMESKVCNQGISSTYSPLNAILNFQPGISAFWTDIEKHMTKLVYDYGNLEEMSVKTLIFSDSDISFNEIQKFLNVSKQNKYITGCSLSFDTLRRYYNGNYDYSYGEKLTNDTFSATLLKKMCVPMFHQMDTFVWVVNDNYNSGDIRFSQMGLFSSYSDVFLAREIFMKEFPEKTVFIKFTSQRDKRIIADMYDVPIISDYVATFGTTP